MLNVLTEIGELFGKYKDRDAAGNERTQDFKDVINNYNNLNRPNNVNQSDKSPFLNSIFSSKFSGSRYYGWQRQVISTLSQQNNDVYIVAPPGGGKTTPVMAYYLINLFMRGANGDFNSLHVNTDFSRLALQNQAVGLWSNIFIALLTQRYMDGTPVPKVLFITPIRVLALEQGGDFQEYFLDMLIMLKKLFLRLPEHFSNNMGGMGRPSYAQMLQQLHAQNRADYYIAYNIIQNLNPQQNRDNARIIDLLLERDPNSQREFETFARNLSLRLVCVQTGGGSGGFRGDIQSSPVIIATAGSASNFINQVSRNIRFIVYDEAHLYQPFGVESGRSQSGEIHNATDAYKIINSVCKSNAQIAFLSGTINPRSATNLANFINNRYNRHIHVVSTERGDPEARNKTNLKIIPDDSIRNEDTLVRYIVEWINRDEKGNAVLLFSKAKIKRILDKVLLKLSPKSNNFNSNQYTRKQKEELDRITREFKYQGLHGPDLNNAVEEYKREHFKTTRSEEIERLKNRPGASSIENTELKTAVSYGIGYIFTQDDKDLTAEDRAAGKEKITEQDKLIVADLFSKQHLNVLLATPSIGIGVNVSIINMYLPTLLKFEGNSSGFGGSRELINKRELSQLINRAGRGKSIVSGIYTPNEFVSYIQDVVNMNNDSYEVVPAITITYADELVVVIGRLNDAASNVARTIYGPFRTAGNATISAGRDFGRRVAEIYRRYFP